MIKYSIYREVSMEKAKWSALEIANWFIARAELDDAYGVGDLLTHLKLQKLLYYAQGAYLALKGKPLFKENIEAWQHGPVVKKVYDKFKIFEANPITGAKKPDLPKDVEQVLEEVYKLFGQYSAWKLREMTHEEKPYLDAVNEKMNGVIDLSVLKKYFEDNYL